MLTVAVAAACLSGAYPCAGRTEEAPIEQRPSKRIKIESTDGATKEDIAKLVDSHIDTQGLF